MNKMDKLISGINTKKKSPNKEKLWEFVQESLSEIGQINESYKKYFESNDDESSPSVFSDIEVKIQKIKNAYINLFISSGEGSSSKIEELEGFYSEIKEFHEELLDGDESKKSDIEEAHSKISSFYLYLFGDNEENEGIEPEVKKAVKDILQSKKDILDFEEHLKDKVKPALKNVQRDIDTKRKEVNALLSNATVRTLAQGYSESKHEYSRPAEKEFRFDKKWWLPFHFVYIFLFNVVWRHLSFILGYALFILPLVAVSFIFLTEQTAQIILRSLVSTSLNPTALELIYVKTIISLPLIWISWYGQRNISQRKRLFEEYNHKLRVVQLYLMFTSKEESSSYQLDDRTQLEKILLDVIARNPSEVFGSDETILDKVADIVYAKQKGVDSALEKVEKTAEKATE